jgi:hypothetical protein
MSGFIGRVMNLMLNATSVNVCSARDVIHHRLAISFLPAKSTERKHMTGTVGELNSRLVTECGYMLLL